MSNEHYASPGTLNAVSVGIKYDLNYTTEQVNNILTLAGRVAATAYQEGHDTALRVIYVQTTAKDYEKPTMKGASA